MRVSLNRRWDDMARDQICCCLQRIIYCLNGFCLFPGGVCVQSSEVEERDSPKGMG